MTRQDVTAGVLAAAVIVLLAALVVALMAYAGYRHDVQAACSGAVARLDLTEWIRVCR